MEIGRVIVSLVLLAMLAGSIMFAVDANDRQRGSTAYLYPWIPLVVAILIAIGVISH